MCDVEKVYVIDIQYTYMVRCDIKYNCKPPTPHLAPPRRKSKHASKGFPLDTDTGSDVREDISSENMRVSGARLTSDGGGGTTPRCM